VSFLPLAAFEMESSSAYVLSCISHPNTTEQNPKPDSRVDKNFDLAMTLPRKIPSKSTPATLIRLSSLTIEVISWASACRLRGAEPLVPGRLVLMEGGKEEELEEREACIIRTVLRIREGLSVT